MAPDKDKALAAAEVLKCVFKADASTAALVRQATGAATDAPSS